MVNSVVTLDKKMSGRADISTLKTTLSSVFFIVRLLRNTVRVTEKGS